jgi:hypothetical protein
LHGCGRLLCSSCLISKSRRRRVQR